MSNHKYYQYQTATYCNDRITRRCLGPRSQCGRFQYWPSTVNRMPEPIRREQLGPLAGAKPIIVVKQNTPLRPWCFSSPTTRVEPFELASTRLRQTRFVKSLENSPGFKKKTHTTHSEWTLLGHIHPPVQATTPGGRSGIVYTLPGIFIAQRQAEDAEM